MQTNPRDYYDRHQLLYNRFWSKNALHYGLWTGATRTLNQAIEETNRVVIQKLAVTPVDRVLDLGSGTGGTAVKFGRDIGCRVTGITISPRQQRQARQYARDAGTADRVEFIVGDFEQPLPFPDGAFTVVTAIESFCHAHDKPAVLRELFRVLAPGGKIALVDGFLERTELTPVEQKMYDIFRTGWQVPSLTTVTALKTFLTTAGFTSVDWDERTSEVIRSSDAIRRLGYASILPAWLLTMFRLWSVYDNSRCMIEQRKMFNGIAQYGIVTAKKILTQTLSSPVAAV